MIGVEISGMTAFEDKELRRRIEEQFKGAEYRGTVEIRVINDFVFVKRESQPYFLLMVYSRGNTTEDLKDIEQRLEALNINSKVVELLKVIRAKK